MGPREIGSDFRIPLSSLFGPTRASSLEGELFLSTGRDCLEATILHYGLKGAGAVALPAYLCPEMLRPFQRHGIPIRFYGVSRKLAADVAALGGLVERERVAAVLTINYFGFEQPDRGEIRSICDEHDAVLIEDDVQAFLSRFPPVGDVVFNSYRKATPMPDGSYLHGVTVRRPRRSLRHALFVACRTVAGALKNVWLLKPLYRLLFQIAEGILVGYPKPAEMSGVSRHILLRLDTDEMRCRRRENYLQLLDRIQGLGHVRPLFEEPLSAETCPFGLPVLCENREEVKSRLIRHRIYPPVHWTLPEEIGREAFADSWWVADRILTIPVDQRYGPDDMDRIADVLAAS